MLKAKIAPSMSGSPAMMNCIESNSMQEYVLKDYSEGSIPHSYSGCRSAVPADALINLPHRASQIDSCENNILKSQILKTANFLRTQVRIYVLVSTFREKNYTCNRILRR